MCRRSSIRDNRIQIALTTAFPLGARARFDVRFACYSGANADTMGLSGLFSSQWHLGILRTKLMSRAARQRAFLMLSAPARRGSRL